MEQVLLSPGGRMVAEWIMDGKPSMDLSLFNPAPFGENARLAGDGNSDGVLPAP